MLKIYSYSHSSDEICPSFLSFVSAVNYWFFSPLHLSLQSSLLHEKHCTQKYIKHSEWIGSCRRRRKQKWYSSQKNNRLFWKCHFFQTACFFIIFFFKMNDLYPKAMLRLLSSKGNLFQCCTHWYGVPKS